MIDQETMEAPPSATSASPPVSSDSDEETSDGEDFFDQIFQKLEAKKGFYDWEEHRRKRKRKQRRSQHKRKRQRMDAPVPVIGHVLGKKDRKNLLKHMPDTTNKYQWRTQVEGELLPTDNWPKCGKCEKLARPAILMFGDGDWLPDQVQKERWMLWQYALLKLCKKRRKKEEAPLKVCILEIGCGMNVPTCRVEAEQMTQAVMEKGGEVDLIRINPDFPLASFPSVRDNIIPIMSRGLEAIQTMDHYYNKIKLKEK